MYLIMCNFTSYFSLGVYRDLTVPINSMTCALPNRQLPAITVLSWDFMFFHL